MCKGFSMKIDICTSTYRNIEKLQSCISGVIAKTKYVDYQWYIQVNDPTEEIKQAIEDTLYIDDILITDRVEVSCCEDNYGTFSSNNNKLAKLGISPYILFLNDDVVPINDDWLYQMASILETDLGVGAVGACLFYPDGKVQSIGTMFDERTNGLPYHIFYKQYPTEYINYDRYYQAVTAACMLVRREDFEKLGGFEETYKYGYEDVSMCLNLKYKLDKNIVYCAGARLVHYEGISGTFKEHPNLQHNIAVFREQWKDKIFNDHQFYLNDPQFMLYKRKNIIIPKESEDENEEDFDDDEDDEDECEDGSEEADDFDEEIGRVVCDE